MAKIPDISELEKEIKSVIADMTGMEPGEIGSEDHFYDVLGIDSIKGIELTVALQDKFGVRVKDTRIPQLTNVKLVAQEVKDLLTKKAEG